MSLFSCLCLPSAKIISTITGFSFFLLFFKHSFWRSNSGPHACILSWLSFPFKCLCHSKSKGAFVSLFFFKQCASSSQLPIPSSLSSTSTCLAFVYPVISFPFPLQILSFVLFISICKCLSEISGNLDLHAILSRTV